MSSITFPSLTGVLSSHCFQITIILSVIHRPRHLGQGKKGKAIQSGNGGNTS